MHDVILSVENLRKIYPGKRKYVAVDGISFQLHQGEILGLLGPNGAGKTTTIQMLLSTLKPTSGSIVYFGKNFLTHRSEILKHVVFASTYVSLPYNLTVRQNLEIFGKLYGIPSKKLKMRIEKTLDTFGILSKLNAQVASLSAGQITRLMLTKAFIVEPKVALLDEPTASLDPDIAKDVCQFVLEQREKHGVSILFTSHNMTEVSELCDRVLFLQHGKIIADDKPKKLAKSIATAKVTLVITDGLKRAKKIAENLNLTYQVEYRKIELKIDEEQIAELLSSFAIAGIHYNNISISHPTLEDYFLKMVEK